VYQPACPCGRQLSARELETPDRRGAPFRPVLAGGRCGPVPLTGGSARARD